MPESAGEAIFHVRGYTKGVPSVNDNNHPVRYGRAVVVHNGHLDNDDALFRRHGVPRSTPHITVDSEAIAMLADRSGDIAEALDRGARQRSRRRALGRRARPADARAPRLAPALPRPRRRLRPLRLDAGAARARGAGDGPARARRGDRARAARWSCARAASSRAAASTSTAATSARRSSRTRRSPRSPRCCASRSPRSEPRERAATSRCRRARPSRAC